MWPAVTVYLCSRRLQDARSASCNPHERYMFLKLSPTRHLVLNPFTAIRENPVAAPDSHLAAAEPHSDR